VSDGVANEMKTIGAYGFWFFGRHRWVVGVGVLSIG
jgi:hypothetical protein